ncbi:MAG: anhydro-N-acetylmuramic acid kinase [Bacteroidales bacterium]|jgi:anhydro-N-acetylmuramic acid kinase|nr:anhydro-N-acetylmuramic acid kinase [Bacteroidales bacterium]
MKKTTLIGTMSGTSLDGLDICAVTFQDTHYSIVQTKTIEYPKALQKKLALAHTLSGKDLAQLSVDYGIFCGKEIHTFGKTYSIHAEYAISHGHTVFHTPKTGVSLQIGSGSHISKHSKLNVIYNLRNMDIAHGGQGAPLVPIGDEYLFPEYDYCLNIGGFANVSTRDKDKRIAWDICGANIILNHYSQKAHKQYDKNGELGSRGTIQTNLLNKLNSLPYFSKSYPKSLGREWIEESILPIINQYNYSLADILRTIYEHIAIQIGDTLSKSASKTLCTGGGCHNAFLIDLIQKYSSSNLIIPTPELINFKEALIFAYLGYLRINNLPNCLASVTGASQDTCGGELIISTIR